MESTIYRKIAEILEEEMKRAKRFEPPIEQVLANLADLFIYAASIIEQSRENDE